MGGNVSSLLDTTYFSFVTGLFLFGIGLEFGHYLKLGKQTLAEIEENHKLTQICVKSELGSVVSFESVKLHIIAFILALLGAGAI